VLEVDANHAEAARIREEAQGVLARFDEAIAQARGHLARGDVQGATRSLETARALDPSAPSVAEISARLSDLVRNREAAAREAADRQASRVAPPREKAPERQAPAAPPQPPAATAPAPAELPPPPMPNPEPQTAKPPAPPRPEPPQNPPAAEPAPTVTPPPAETRPPEKAKPAPSQDEIDDAAIRRVVATYGRAIESKDLALFRSVKPNLSGAEERRLQQGFRAVTSQRVALTIASIDRRGDAATVVIQRRDQIDTGGRQQTVETRQSLTMNRVKDGWVIVEIR
jgi:ketosteroid isomerase-like protein